MNNSVSRTLFRWILVDWFSEQPAGLRLPKDFKIPHGAEFDFEKQQLLKILDAAWHARSPDDWGPHPMFGKMTLSEWGKLLQNLHRLPPDAIRCQRRTSSSQAEAI